MSIVLFGAFDRHNFGDLLLPHVAAALLPGRQRVCAGLAQRVLRAHGGHAVRALADLAADPPRLRPQPKALMREFRQGFQAIRPWLS